MYGSPQSYVKSIKSFAGRSSQAFLHTGAHFMQLADFLKSGTSQVDARDPAFTHLVVHEWIDGTCEVKSFSNARDAVELYPQASTASSIGQLIFIRGYSNSEWLLPLSAQLRIDPEFLRRHLDFLQPKNYYDLPPLPSTFLQGFSLKFITICNRSIALTLDQLHDLQWEEENAVKNHQRNLRAHGRTGASIIRRWSVHDEWTHTLEQSISFYLKQKGNGWVAIAWLDCGRDLTEGPIGPWANPSHYFQAGSRFEPVIQHLPKVSLRLPNGKGNAAIDGDADMTIAQNLRLLPFQYGSSLLEQPNLASADAFYALSELIGLSLASESQFLNLLRTQIAKLVDSTSVQLEPAVNSLRRTKTLMDDHIHYLQTTLQAIRSLSSFNVPKPQAETSDVGSTPLLSERRQDVNPSRRIAESTISDCEHLLRLAENLSRQCVEGTNIIMNSSMLEESRKSIKVNEYLARLSVLAFLFLPLTFTTGFFGMNFREFGQGNLSIWIFCTLLVPVMISGLILCFWNQVSQLFWRLLRSRHF